MNHLQIRDWRKNVYGKTSNEVTQEDWPEIRLSIIIRDMLTCQRCKKEFASDGYLSVHHIVPRMDGGSYDPDNLITLCHICHDYVELEEIRTRDAIVDSWDGEPRKTVYKPKKDKPKDTVKHENFDRPEWHSWVYGGERNPKS